MNIFEMAQIPLNRAIEAMQLDEGAAKIIATPERTLEVAIPVKMDDGTTKVFTGYRSQHSTILGSITMAVIFFGLFSIMALSSACSTINWILLSIVKVTVLHFSPE